MAHDKDKKSKVIKHVLTKRGVWRETKDIFGIPRQTYRDWVNLALTLMTAFPSIIKGSYTRYKIKRLGDERNKTSRLKEEIYRLKRENVAIKRINKLYERMLKGVKKNGSKQRRK